MVHRFINSHKVREDDLWIQQKSWVKKGRFQKVLVKRNKVKKVRSKITLGQKKFGVQQILSSTNFGYKDFKQNYLVLKIEGQQFFV